MKKKTFHILYLFFYQIKCLNSLPQSQLEDSAAATKIFSSHLESPIQQSSETSRNFSIYSFRVPEFYEYGVNFTPSDPTVHRNEISNTGAFIAYSGAKTGRSPAAKRIVTDTIREK